MFLSVNWHVSKYWQYALPTCASWVGENYQASTPAERQATERSRSKVGGPSGQPKSWKDETSRFLFLSFTVFILRTREHNMLLAR